MGKWLRAIWIYKVGPMDMESSQMCMPSIPPSVTAYPQNCGYVDLKGTVQTRDSTVVWIHSMLGNNLDSTALWICGSRALGNPHCCQMCKSLQEDPDSSLHLSACKYLLPAPQRSVRTPYWYVHWKTVGLQQINCWNEFDPIMVHIMKNRSKNLHCRIIACQVPIFEGIYMQNIKIISIGEIMIESPSY